VTKTAAAAYVVRGATGKRHRATTLALLSILWVALSSCHSAVRGHSQERENGQAALAFRIPWRQDFSLDAKLRLPAVATNKNWYSIWVMIAELKGTAERPAMVQAGLVRWGKYQGKYQYRLEPFVVLEHSGETPQMNFPPPLAAGSAEEHEFAISRSGDQVRASMDGKPIFEGAWHAFFRDNMILYGKIGSEVFAPGDAISGTVRQVELKTAPLRLVPYPVFEAAEDRGLKFLCNDDVFTAVGRFDLNLPFRWVASPCKEDRQRAEQAARQIAHGEVKP